jgi:carboxy-terminal domain RNA polymerase II polypeptide A small phosphatase
MKLLHATETPLERAPDHRVFQHSLYLRPGLGAFLEEMDKLFRIAVWTSSSLDYAEQICMLLFPDPVALDFVWARDRCTFRMDWEQQTGLSRQAPLQAAALWL